MSEIAIFIDNESKQSTYEQIYESIKTSIIQGKIPPHDKLPSSRSLSEYLQCSRSTILMAYEQLISEGYIESVPQKGYFAMELDSSYIKAEGAIANRTPHSSETSENYIDFSPNGIEPDSFPFTKWRKILQQIVSPENMELLNSGDPQGDYGLRNTIANYLNTYRGVSANADRIVIGAGNEILLTILNSLFDNNVEFAMENPSYQKTYNVFSNYGRKIRPVTTTQSGLCVDELTKSSADVIYVTPSHQYPLGTVMDITTRIQLLNWASKSPSHYIIEDDYDSEFRYKGKPIPALSGIDRNDKVIYLGTFSKTISPSIRVSYMLLPEVLYKRYSNYRKMYSNTVPRIDQKALEIFMEDGSYERHLNKMRKKYKQKHDFLLSELKSWKNIELYGENSGSHILIKYLGALSENDLIDSAINAGVRIYPLSTCFIGNPNLDCSFIILGYAKLNQASIQKGLSILKKIWAT